MKEQIPIESLERAKKEMGLKLLPISFEDEICTGTLNETMECFFALQIVTDKGISRPGFAIKDYRVAESLVEVFAEMAEVLKRDPLLNMDPSKTLHPN